MPNWKKLITSGSDAALNSLDVTTSLIASGLTYPTTDGDNGDFLTTDGGGNLSFGRPNVFANVKNVSGTQLAKGTPVHATGTAGNASEVIAASASVASTMPATYILNETLADDAEGLAIITGYINGVNTSLFGEGDVVYVGENGGFTNVKPQGSDNLIQNLGVVSKVAANGSGYIYGSGRSNDVPNLPENKIWVGSDTYTVTSSILTLDEDNSHAQITGSLSVSSVVNAGTDTDKFLVLDSSNNVDFRTGAEVRSDIGAGTGNGTVTGTGADNQVTTWDGTTSLDGSSNFTYDGTTLNLTYTGTGDLLRLTSTDAGAASAPDLTFCRDSASPADDDTLGTIQFYGEVSGTSVCKNYASIYGRIACATNGQTKGNLSFKAECNNVFIDTANFSPNGLYVMPPDDFAITSPGIGLTVTGGVSGSTTLQIGSGHSNTGTLSSIAGGTLNTVSAACGFIGGGSTNTIGASNCSVIVGGANNCITDSCSQASTIVGGTSHCVKGKYGFIGGGGANQICFLHDYAAIAGGNANIICSPYAFIGGGKGNCVKRNVMSLSGCYSAVVAGQNNSTNANFSFIGGGCANCIPCQGCFTSIGGGQQNAACGPRGFIGGGYLNLICSSETYATIGGGRQNQVDGDYSSIVGGYLNCANGNCSFIGGGQQNTGSGVVSFIGGGCNNSISCYNANSKFDIIVGGDNNTISNDYNSCNNTIVGGKNNTFSGAYAQFGFIGGGCNNDIVGAGFHSVIGGGSDNYINGSNSFIGGGCDNCNQGFCSGIVSGKLNIINSNSLNFIGGGFTNCTVGRGSSIVGGCINSISGYNNQQSFIGGGCCNTISGAYCKQSFIGGGCQNIICSTNNSVIVGGTLNTASGNFSFIGGGQSNIAEGVHSYAGGQESCTTGAQGFAHGYQACATGGASVAFGAVQEAIGDNSFIAGGASNSACAQYSFVGGFNNETTTSAKASSVLGENNCVNAPWSFAVGSDNCILGGNVLAVAGGNIVGGKVNRVQGTYSLGNLVMGNDNCIGDGSSGVGGAAAFGGGNCILADGTVAIGINNNNPVSGQTGYGCNTLLLGCNNQAHFGENNIIGGTDSDGYGTNSIAFGFGATSATGGQQYAFGCGTTNPNNATTANIDNSFVIGRYNVWNISDCHLFAVGDGFTDGTRTNALNVSSNGRTGLGCTSPQTRLDVNGTTRTTSLVETSARRYKENIVSLQDQLENIKKLEPVEFEWKKTKKKDIGLIAEDVEKVYPQLVEHDDNGDLMGVKYSKITSLLIKAVQEQQEQIDQLKIEIELLKQNK